MVLNPTMPATAGSARAAAGDGLQKLCEWAVAARRRPLPAAVRRRAALVLADDIAAVAAAAGEPQVADARAILLGRGGAGEASVFAAGLPRTGREQAAACNGLAVTWAELDEGYRALPCHAGAYILPALLAEAEAEGHAVGAVIGALAIAYEITARIARSYPFHRLTVHPHAAFNAIGAAAGLSVLRGHDAPTLFAAISAAATLVNAGPFNHAIEGALVRNVWTSIGAQAGFRAADFAPLGIAGLRAALHDVFVDAFGCEPHPAELVTGLGDGAWAVEGGYHKMYACCQYTHSAVQASLELAGRVSVDDVARIEVETHARGLALDVRKPETVLAAKFSMPHALAAVAVHRSGGPESFDAASLNDPAVARLRESVRLLPHPAVRDWPNDRPARVHWIMVDGTRQSASVDSARGGTDQPFGEDELIGKIATLTAPLFPQAGRALAALVGGTIDAEMPWPEMVQAIAAGRQGEP